MTGCVLSPIGMVPLIDITVSSTLRCRSGVAVRTCRYCINDVRCMRPHDASMRPAGPLTCVTGVTFWLNPKNGLSLAI